ncbi:hypothetical protein [Kitasatospora sp. GAS1066B]|uniref:hypothetical protein n=1 Tax=Kitasatospora sp. GAS1066B TaxID=3156271 RepID=UPI00351187CF
MENLSDEDQRGLTALFWSDVNPHGTFRLDMDMDMDKRLALGLTAAVPVPALRWTPPTDRVRGHDEGPR